MRRSGLCVAVQDDCRSVPLPAYLYHSRVSGHFLLSKIRWESGLRFTVSSLVFLEWPFLWWRGCLLVFGLFVLVFVFVCVASEANDSLSEVAKIASSINPKKKIVPGVIKSDVSANWAKLCLWRKIASSFVGHYLNTSSTCTSARYQTWLCVRAKKKHRCHIFGRTARTKTKKHHNSRKKFAFKWWCCDLATAPWKTSHSLFLTIWPKQHGLVAHWNLLHFIYSNGNNAENVQWWMMLSDGNCSMTQQWNGPSW